MFTVGSSVTLGDVPSLPVRSPHEPELSIAEIWHAQMEHQHFGHSSGPRQLCDATQTFYW